MIFQNYHSSLLPWRTVLGNVLLALEHKQGPKKQKVELAEGFLESVGLRDFGKHYPWELSGGMQQRVAIARGLAYGSDIILMDEPFASVDAQTRSELEDFLLQIWKQYRKTILFVTHDIDEAVYLSDRVIVLSKRPAVVVEPRFQSLWEGPDPTSIPRLTPISSLYAIGSTGSFAHESGPCWLFKTSDEKLPLIRGSWDMES